MKTFYKIVIFLAMFQMTILVTNATGVFPYTLYSDVETQDFRDFNSPMDVIGYLFALPDDIPLLPDDVVQFGWTFLLFAFGIAGAVYSRVTHSWTPLIVIILVGAFVPMITKSLGFFNKLFTNWDVASLTYLSVALGVGIFIIVIITVLETPTHGRS